MLWRNPNLQGTHAPADHTGDCRGPLRRSSPGSQLPRLLPAPEPDPHPRFLQDHGWAGARLPRPPRLGLAVTCGVTVTVCVRLPAAPWAPWRPGPESLTLLPRLVSLPARGRPSPGPPHGQALLPDPVSVWTATPRTPSLQTGRCVREKALRSSVSDPIAPRILVTEIGYLHILLPRCLPS